MKRSLLSATTVSLRAKRRLRASNLRCAAAVSALAMMGSTSSLLSQTLYWDGSDAAALQSGNGTWSIGSSLWSTSTNPAASTRVPWTNGSDAVFEASGPSAVTVSGTVNVNSITFGGTGYTIGGTALTLTGTGGNITTTSAGAISAPIAGSVGLTKLGASTLTLSGANTYTGTTTVSGGTLALGADNVIGAGWFGSGDATVSGSGILDLGTFTDRVGVVTLQGSGQINGTGTLISNSRFTSSGVHIAGGFEMQSGSVSAILSGTFGLNKTTGGTLTLSGANTYTGLTTVSDGTLAYGASNVIGIGKVTVSGTGILDLGAFTDTVSTVTLQGGQITGTGTLTTDGSFELQSGSVNAILAGGGIALNKTTTGTVTLSGANTYTGLTTVSAGTLAYGASDVIGTGDVTVSGTGILALGASRTDTVGTVTLSGTGQITGSGTSTLTSTGTFELQAGSVSAILAGAVPLNKTTAGTVILSGANTYTGATSISGGTLQIGNGTSGSLNGTAGTALTFQSNGGTFRVMEAAGSSQGMGTLTFSAGGGSSTVNSTYAGTPGANVTTLTFSSLATRGARATGNFEVSGGANGTDNRIVITAQAAGFIDRGFYYNGADFAAMSSAGGYVRALAYGTDANAAAVDTFINNNHVKLTATPATRAGDTLRSLNLAGSGVGYTMSSGSLNVPGILKSGGGTQGVISGGTSVTTTSNAELVIRTDTASDLLAINTAIAGTSGGLTKTGAGTLTLGGANTYTGATSVVEGTLAYGASDVISTGAVTVNGSTAILDLGAFSDSVGTVTLSGGGSITGTGTLTSTGSFAMQSGSVSANLAGSAALTKATSTDTVTLSGNNSYTGGTTLTLGTLALGSANAIGNSGTITFSNGTLQYSASNQTDYSARFSNADNQRYNIDTNGQSVTLASNLTSGGTGGTAGRLNKMGAGTLTLSGNNSYTGSTTLTAGTLALGSAGAIGSTGQIIFAGGTLQYSASNQTDYSSRFIGSPGNAGGGRPISIDTNGQNVTFASNNTSRSTVTKLGAGTLTLMGSNGQFTGMTVWEGTLAGHTNSLKGAIEVKSGAELKFVFPTFSGPSTAVVSGAGAVTIDYGIGFVRFTGDNSYTGGTTLSSGRLVLDSANPIGSTGTITFNGGNLVSSSYNSTDYSARFSNAANQQYNLDTADQNVNLASNLTSSGGSFQKGGIGTLRVTGNNSYDGTTSIVVGTLAASNIVVNGGSSNLGNASTPVILGNAASTVDIATLAYTGNTANYTRGFTLVANSLGGAGRLDVTTAGQTLTVSSGGVTGTGMFMVGGVGDTIISSDITHTGGLTKADAGTLTLTGTNTYSGATTVTAGQLVVNGSSSGSAHTVGNGGTLGGIGTVGALLVQSGGTIAPGNSPGILNVSGNTTWENGGNYNWQLLDATGAAGTGWDQLAITGALDLASLTAGGFNVNVWSLSSALVNGNAQNFDGIGGIYSWPIATASGGITGFNASNFFINTAPVNGTTGFTNDFTGGTFSMSQTGNNLYLNYLGPTPVPEPASALTVLALFSGAVLQRRKRVVK